MRRLFFIRRAVLTGVMGMGLCAGAVAGNAAADKGTANASGSDDGKSNGTTADLAIPDGTMVIAPAALDALTKVGTTRTGTKVGRRKEAAVVQTGGRAPLLLRTGFRAKDHRGEVSLQTSGAVELQTRPNTADNTAVFLLKRCRALRRTDRLPLETQFFRSSVTRVSVKQRGPDLEVVIALRGPVKPEAREEAGPSGSTVWVLDFPPVVTSRTATAAANP